MEGSLLNSTQDQENLRAAEMAQDLAGILEIEQLGNNEQAFAISNMPRHPDNIDKLIEFHRINSYLNKLAMGPFNPLLRPNLSSRNKHHAYLLRNIDFRSQDYKGLSGEQNMRIVE